MRKYFFAGQSSVLGLALLVIAYRGDLNECGESQISLRREEWRIEGCCT